MTSTQFVPYGTEPRPELVAEIRNQLAAGISPAELEKLADELNGSLIIAGSANAFNGEDVRNAQWRDAILMVLAEMEGAA